MFVAMVPIFIVSCSAPEEEALNIADLQTSLDAEKKAKNNVAKAKMYTVNFGELNGSGVSGTAELTLMGDQLTVKVNAGIGTWYTTNTFTDLQIIRVILLVLHLKPILMVMV